MIFANPHFSIQKFFSLVNTFNLSLNSLERNLTWTGIPLVAVVHILKTHNFKHILIQHIRINEKKESPFIYKNGNSISYQIILLYLIHRIPLFLVNIHNFLIIYKTNSRPRTFPLSKVCTFFY